MANTVAGLAVSLGLNATEYYQGLTKAEYQAKKFSQSFSSGMGALKGALGGLGVGLIVNEIYDLGKSIISTAAELNDFADQTGSSVENLSKLSNQAQIAGTSFEELQNATLKLAVGMGSAGEKGAKVDAILKTLGVTAKDPAEAMQQIAVAFLRYEDGATKAAYSQELFGKTGTKFLATLKDIANLQDVAATTTKKQAEEAEKLEQAYRRIGAEATLFKNAILSDVVPVLLRVITEFNEARRAGLGFWEALKLIGTGQVGLEDRIESATKKLEEERKAFAAASRFGIAGLPFTGSEEKVKDAEKALRALQALHAETKRGAEDRKFNPFAQQLPGLGGAAGGGRGARTPADRISDAERYFASLEQQLQKTQELTAVETILADVEAGRFKVANAAQMSRALAIGGQIDAAKALEKAEKEREQTAKEEMRAREQASKIKQQGLADLNAETAALAQGNEQMRQEIEAIGLDATSMAQLTQRRLEAAAATKEQEAAMLRNTIGMEAEAKALEDQARILRDRKGLLVQRGVAEQMAADVQKAKEINDLFVDSFAEGARSIVRDSASIGDAVKRMGDRITDVLLDMATKNIATSLFGAPTSSGGGGIFGAIGTAIMGSIFGGGSSGYGMNVRAKGGPVVAGQPYMIGERGPEMFIPRTSGTVVANNKMGGNFVFNINVPAGASKSTIDQTRVQFGLALQNALDRGELMAFLETPRLQDCPSFGVTGGPSFSTSIAEMDSGVEYANQNWEQARRPYVMSFDARKPKVVNDLIGFFHAVHGQFSYFRLKDPFDHTDIDLGGYVATSAAGVFSVIDATHYQMYKRYTAGALVHNRKIQKPVVGKVSVTGGSGISIDYTTGIVTSTGAPTSWAGEFDVPVRFLTDVMRAIIVAKNNTNLITGWQNIELIEVRLI